MDALPSHRARQALGGGSAKHLDPISLGRTSSTSSIDSPSYGGSGDASGSQSLASILNNPLAGRSDAPWSAWWPYGTGIGADMPQSLVPSTPIPEVNRADFQQYVSSICEAYARFEDVRNHSSKEIADGAEIRGQGEALVACLREVPSLFFKEDFALEEGATFRAACPFSPVGLENSALQEKLSHYLDVVEMHLVKEISLRSDSFFEAQGKLQGLNGEILEACIRIRELKENIRVLNVNLVDSARQVQELNATRENLVKLQQKLTVILYVGQSLAALKLLVASADCAGALDVIDDLQHLLDSDELTGLHCFRHLRDQLSSSIDSINSILSAEFLHGAIYDAKSIHSVAPVKVNIGTSDLISRIEDVKLDEEEKSNFRDRLLPLIVGLLRIAKLPSVLRVYRETLIAAMKTSIKNTVAELLPVLGSRSVDTELTGTERAVETDGGSSLASKLRNLSPESFLQLLVSIFTVVQAHLVRAAEVKRMIEWILGNLDGYAIDSVVAVTTAVENSFEINPQLASSSLAYSQNVSKGTPIYGRTNENYSPSTTKNFRTDVLRENAEALFAACDAAHGRWAKLLSVRALLHPKLKLQEFLSIYTITQSFITTTEKIGGRMGYSIRGTLQSQSKAFFDFQHESRMAKIRAVLDQETWVAVDVPEEFQAIVDSFSPDMKNVDACTDATSSSNKPVLNHSQISDSETTVDGPLRRNGSVEASSGHSKEIKPNSTGDGNINEPGRSISETLVYKGVGYHMVNCGLILLKTLSEYIDVSKYLPALSPEVGHRVVEILKFFNTRTCQLVLGAGAMQVSGLKSITSKHLALASQVISFISVIIPEIRSVLFLKISEIRKAVLLADIDKVTQDYIVHRDEIHSKLVQIMRERLLANIRKLPQIVESWNGPEEGDEQPSVFARSVVKEVSYLHRILSQTLLEVDVQLIFRQVVQIFHLHISEAYSKLEINTPQAKNRLYRDAQHILGCIRKLPADHSSKDAVANLGLLDEFLEQRLGSQPSS